MLIHGGDLDRASREFGIAPEQWLDLSTGISPWTWPVPNVPAEVWRRLPGTGDGLSEAAAACYGCAASQVLPTPGSQFAIEALPGLRQPAPVALPQWGYEEHRAAWVGAGHEPRFYGNGAELARLLEAPDLRCAVVINPDNPTAQVIPPARLRAWAGTLHQRGGLLVVDEAFADAAPGISLVPNRPAGAVVLRSVGKFFGLAGLRLGFAIGEPDLLQVLAARLAPWAVSHPARWVGRRALADDRWQALQRHRLAVVSDRWRPTLAARFPELRFDGCELFVSGFGDWETCRHLYRAAGERGLLLRLMGPRQGRGILRFGLPAEGEEARAKAVLEDIACSDGRKE